MQLLSGALTMDLDWTGLDGADLAYPQVEEREKV